MARSGGVAMKPGSPTRQREESPSNPGLDWIDEIPSCPVFHPSKEQFKDPLQYLQSIAPHASKYGICKIVSPITASVPATVVLTKEQLDFKFTSRVQPLRLGNWDKDDKIIFYMSGRNYSLPEYEKMANKIYHRKFSTAASLPARLVEAEFWQEMVSGKMASVEYACDIEGSAFSSSQNDDLAQSKWNLKEISQHPESVLRLLDCAIPGVTEPMLYMGMLFSTFAWHVEDHYLYSINYHHCGALKTWYGVPGQAAADFEKVVEEHVYEKGMLTCAGEGATHDLLMGKTTMFAPKLLVEHGVPLYRAVQAPGEFIITFPRSYHAGFSHGFNCGEAVNFATTDWLPVGAAACQRYSRLGRMPLLPYEELVCKEVLLRVTTGAPSPDAKSAFVALIRQAKEVTKGAGRAKPFSSVSCCLCKHVCYVAFLSCNCIPGPVCLNHGKDLHDRNCGCERVVFVRDDFAKMEAVARFFESSSGALSELQPQLQPQPELDFPTMDAEDDSEDEAFRVKRRRISVSLHKSTLLPTAIRSSCPPKVYNTTGGDKALLVRDIMCELDVKGSALEAVSKWLLRAQSKAVALKAHRVVIESRQYLAFSLKGCKSLRKILPEKEAWKLKKMIGRLEAPPSFEGTKGSM